MKNSSKASNGQLPHTRKSLCFQFGSISNLAGRLVVLLLGTSLTSSAFILDNFNGASLSGWTSTLNGGSVAQSGGQLTITPIAVPGALTYSRKTDRTFTNLATHTLEFKVLVNSILTNSVTTNGLAVLGWVPTGGALGANGYALGVGAGGVGILANSTFIFTTNFATSLQSSNIYLAMRMTPEGANMIVKSTVYNKTDGRFNVLFEYTVTNSATPLIGIGGNAILGAFNDASGGATSVSFDDLQYYDTVRAVLDDFSGPYPGTGWTDYTPGTATNYNDGLGHLVTVDQSAGPTSGTFRSDRTFRISDGVRLEFRIDIVEIPSASVQDFAVLGYIPNGLADFADLTEYHLAFTAAQFYVGKRFGVWWDAAYNLFAPQSNIRLIQTFTGEGTSVRIESRLEDLSMDVNDPARVVYQRMIVDNGIGSIPPYINRDGYFALSQYRNNPPGNVAVTWDNAEVNSVVGGNAPPIVSGASPAGGKNFHSAASGISFNINDDASAPINNIKLTLNGVVYTNGSPGVTITPPDVSSLSRQFTFTNLAPNVFYVGSIQASDNLGATTTIQYQFDTFLTNNIQVEAEDFNYSTNVTVDGGAFFDAGLNAYAGLEGTAEIDYHDSRAAGNFDNPIPYRPLDYPRQYLTGEPPRSQYVLATQPEYLVYDNNNGDWRNYTRTFPAGTYLVYSRQSTFLLPVSQVTLERVTSDPHTNGQTTTVLGSFIQLGDAAGDTGYDVHRNVPLTDAAGNPTVVRFTGGVDTLRVTDRYVENNEDSDVFHNYLVFVPTADPGTLRPIVTHSAPIAGDTFRMSPATEATFASIANRDTTVTNIVALKMNGVDVAFTPTITASGMDVNWSLFVVPAAPTITNTLIYRDSEGATITNNWTYSYPFLRASNSLPLGSLSTRGFDVRMVQTDIYPNPDNTIAKGEDQLAIPPVVPYDRTWQTNVQTLDWNDSTGIPNYVPGLDGGISGFPPGPYNYIATEELAYLELTAGAHRLVVVSDDSFQLRSGTSLTDTSARVLGFQNGTFSGSFDFVVEADGLYPLRGMWQEEGGGANFSLSSLNRIGGTNNIVNDPGDPPGGVKAYLPVTPTVLLSSAAVGGPYTAAAGAAINPVTKTVTVPISGSMQFYRMSSASAVTIQSITVVGSNVVITYQ